MSEFLAQPAGILLLVFGGIALGKLLAWAVLRGRIDAARLEGRAAAEPELAALRASLSETREQLAAETARGARLPEIERTLDRERQTVLAAEQKLGAAQAASEAELARIRAQLEAEREASRQKLALLDEAKAQLTEQFRNLATEILEDKSRRFTEQNQQNLGQLLDPLRMRIAEFQQKVETAYDTEGKERAALGERLSQLMALNQQISKEANDLTRALKGSTKAQGGWGEMLLESLLETAGLVRGQQYEVQAHHQREDGSRAQPDVVIRMPEDRRLVVDAKVSLLAYEQYASAEDESAREEALARHLDSVRSHVKGLAARDYQELHGEGSPDFVLMFVA
ncbi:MAG: DNA recombination protein RmuC, partial [Gammaproteobacteria bacterium]